MSLRTIFRFDPPPSPPPPLEPDDFIPTLSPSPGKTCLYVPESLGDSTDVH